MSRWSLIEGMLPRATVKKGRPFSGARTTNTTRLTGAPRSSLTPSSPDPAIASRALLTENAHHQLALCSTQSYHGVVADSPDIRISDDERESALAALGTHMSSGRLDVYEFSERSEQVAVAKTRGEVIRVFHDLPDPQPEFGVTRVPTADPIPDAERETHPVERRKHSVGKRFATRVVPAVIVAAVVVFALTNLWLLLVIAVVAAIAGGVAWAASRTRHGSWMGDSAFDAKFDAEFDKHFNAHHSPYAKDYTESYTRNYLRNYLRKYGERYDSGRDDD